MAFDLATAQHIQALEAKLDLVLTQLAAKPVPAEDQLLSVQEVAGYTHFDRKTVESWVHKGRYDTRGKLVYLRAYEFSGRLRFKRADVEAFGLGVGVLTPSLTGQRPEPTKVAPAAKKPKKSSPVASDKALRVA
jgi:excisionase family DNA binding protein